MKKFFCCLTAVIAVCSCDPGSFGVSDEDSYCYGYVPLEHEMIVLGDKLEDPYTVENMTKAFNSVYPTRSASIGATDLYVRFLPKSEMDVRVLEGLGVEMLDHPVDYEILREGDYYRDPSVPEGEITWQYATVPKEFRFPAGIRYELLDECFISEHEVVTRSDCDIDWEAVERESFRLTGNGDMPELSTKAGGYPSGRITIVDDRHPDMPLGVKGVKVSCNVFVKFCEAYTDEDGNYSMKKSFAKSPRFRLVFKNRKGFAFGFNLVLVQGSISTLGNGAADGMSVEVDRNSDRMLFARCAANNAAYDYYESCKSEETGVKTPPSDARIWLFTMLEDSSAPMLHQGAVIDNSLLSDYLGEYSSLAKMFLPDVTIGISGKRDYSSIYASVVHELAHASHYMQVGNDYWKKLVEYTLKSFVTAGGDPYGSGTASDRGYCAVGEMWAYFMQTRMYRDRYPSEAVSFGSSYWFSPQIFFYMDERGITRDKIFRALTSDIHDVDMLHEKLLSMYPECKTIINQAFDRYQ